MKLHVQPLARDDIIHQFRYYLLEADVPNVAFRFLDAVEAAFTEIERRPAIGAPKHFDNPALAGLRVWSVRGFDEMHVYYVSTQSTLRVIRVLHSKRDVVHILQSESSDED